MRPLHKDLHVSVMLVLALMLLWAIGANIQMGHQLMDREIRIVALKQLLKECKP